MKKIELVYFRECPTVPNARKALHEAHISFTEVVQDELAQEDVRRKYCSPSLLVEGEVVVGARVEEASCALDRWDSEDTVRLLKGLDSDEQGIGCCIKVGTSRTTPLTRKQRIARVGAGLAMLGLAFATMSIWPLALLFGWFGLSHVVAGISGYTGCPELGAIPSAVLGRSVATRCGPWEWLDKRFHLGVVIFLGVALGGTLHACRVSRLTPVFNISGSHGPDSGSPTAQTKCQPDPRGLSTL
jgi:hypothetical protein